MEFIFGLIGLGILFMIPAGFFLGMAARGRSLRNEARLDDLKTEIIGLHSRLDVLARRLKEAGSTAPAATAPEVKVRSEPERAPAPLPVALPAAAPPETPSAAPPKPAPAPKTEPIPPPPVAATTPSPAAAATDDAAPASGPPPAPPRRAVVSAQTPVHQRPARLLEDSDAPAHERPARTVAPEGASARRRESLEMAIGSSWLNRIGIALVVIGITFALGYTLTHLGPGGKSALATAAALALLVAGVRLEAKEGYTAYGRGLMAGGWAGLYVTAYAVHELDATRIIESAAMGFALLLLVGAGMIVHSLRYKNEGLTVLTYALSYGAIVIHSIRPYTLAAAALLGAGTVAHLLRRRWYGAAIGGLLATYGSLFLWHSRQAVTDLSTLRLGLTALAVDWAVFITAEFGPRPSDDTDRLRARWLSALNAIGVSLMAFSAFEQVSPGGAWRVLAALGIVYTVTSALLRRTGRTASHQVHSIAAAAFVALAAARALHPIPATWAVLVESIAILFLGVRLRDRFHRILGCCFLVPPLAAIVAEQLGARATIPDGRFQASRLAVVLAGIGAAYLAAWSLKRIDFPDRTRPPESGFAQFFSYAAFTLVLLAFFVQLPTVYVAPASAVLMLVLFAVSRLLGSEDLEIQGYLSAGVATACAAGMTAPSPTTMGSFPARVPALLVVAGALWSMKSVASAKKAGGQKLGFARFFSYAAFALVLLVFYLQLESVYVAPATAVLMLALFAVSRLLGSEDLEIQAYLSAAVATTCAIGLTAPSHATLGSIAARVPALLVVAGALITGFIGRKHDATRVSPQWPAIRPAFAWAGIGLAALAAWLQARPVAVGPAWMVMALVAVEWGILSREPSLRQPGYTLVFASHVSMVLSNLTATDLVGGISIRAATMIPSLAATYYLWWRLRALDGRGDERAANGGDELAGRLFSYLGAAAAGLFSRFEFGLDGATIRWSAILVGLFLLGYVLRDADFRVQGYLLTFAIAVRAAGFDFVQASPFMGIDGPAAVAISSCLGLVAGGFIIRRAIAAPSEDRRSVSFESELAPRGQDILWLLAVGLAGTYFYRAVSGFMLIVAWALEGSVATAWGFGTGSRPLRIAGLGILAVALATTLVRTFTEFDTMGRIVSFIVLGVLLLLVSLAYTRYISKTKSAS